ncbi:MAG: hypothetical protein AB7O97_10135 [Planctomycetota bacterium]
MEVEDRFELNIDDRDAEKAVTVADLEDLVVRLLPTAANTETRTLDAEQVRSRLYDVIAERVGMLQKDIRPENSWVNGHGMD